MKAPPPPRPPERAFRLVTDFDWAGWIAIPYTLWASYGEGDRLTGELTDPRIVLPTAGYNPRFEAMLRTGRLFVIGARIDKGTDASNYKSGFIRTGPAPWQHSGWVTSAFVHSLRVPLDARGHVEITVDDIVADQGSISLQLGWAAAGRPAGLPLSPGEHDPCR